MSQITSESGAGGTPPPARRTALIVWCVLVAGVLVFAAVGTAAGPGFGSRRDESFAEILGWTAIGMSLVSLLVSRVLRRAKALAGAPPDGVALARTIMTAAVNEGAAIFAVVAWMVGGAPQALAALAISLVGLLLAFPSAAGWQKLGGAPERSTETNPLVR